MANINDKTSKIISKLCDELKLPANKKYLKIIKKNLTSTEEEIDILGKLRAIQKDITYIKKRGDAEQSRSKIRCGHSPKDTADFLNLFNDPNGFKYLTHDFADYEDIDKLLAKFKSVFDKATKQYKIPPSLYALIKFFIFGQSNQKSDKNYWIDCHGKKMYVSWSSSEWLDWARKNRKHPILNNEFEKTISDFRLSVRIIAPNLKDLINNSDVYLKMTKDYKFNIDFIDIGKADFYTNSHNLKKIIERILSTMAQRKDHPKIKICYERSTSGDYLERKIILSQIDSFPENKFDDVRRRLLESSNPGDFGEIRKLCFGYCNWSVETKWDQEWRIWNILDDKGKDDIETLECAPQRFAGFTHILTFYQK
jgi:hypothetical protein